MRWLRGSSLAPWPMPILSPLHHGLLATAARSFGRTIGAGSESLGENPPGGNLERVANVLAPYGYEPRIS